MANKEPGYVYILTNPSFRAKYFSYNGKVLDEIRKGKEEYI